MGAQDATAIANTASGSFLANGTLFTVRAGNVTSSLQFGANYSDFECKEYGAGRYKLQPHAGHLYSMGTLN